MERGLCLAQVEVLGEVLLDLGVEPVGAACEENQGQYEEGDDHQETYGEVHEAGHHKAHHEECYEVAQHQQRNDNGLAETVGVEHLAYLVLAHVLDGYGPQEWRHEHQRAHQSQETAPNLWNLKVGKECVEEGPQQSRGDECYGRQDDTIDEDAGELFADEYTYHSAVVVVAVCMLAVLVQVLFQPGR